MSSGTRITVCRYYNGHHYYSVEDIDDHINEYKERIEQTWSEILALCVATPNHIVPSNTGEEPLSYIINVLEEKRGYLDFLNEKLNALYDIRDGWDTREED